MVTLLRAHVEEMCAHALRESPRECCGWVGAKLGKAVSGSVYRLRNVAADATVAYEAAAEDLFAAQRLMRERGEELLGIYHSHPRAAEPAPSKSDVRLAYYPDAVYFIIGLGEDGAARLRAFRISKSENRWREVPYEIAEG